MITRHGRPVVELRPVAQPARNLTPDDLDWLAGRRPGGHPVAEDPGRCCSAACATPSPPKTPSELWGTLLAARPRRHRPFPIASRIIFLYTVPHDPRLHPPHGPRDALPDGGACCRAGAARASAPAPRTGSRSPTASPPACRRAPRPCPRVATRRWLSGSSSARSSAPWSGLAGRLAWPSRPRPTASAWSASPGRRWSGRCQRRCAGRRVRARGGGPRPRPGRDPGRGRAQGQGPRPAPAGRDAGETPPRPLPLGSLASMMHRGTARLRHDIQAEDAIRHAAIQAAAEPPRTTAEGAQHALALSRVPSAPLSPYAMGCSPTRTPASWSSSTRHHRKASPGRRRRPEPWHQFNPARHNPASHLPTSPRPARRRRSALPGGQLLSDR